jgi:hypothetical protein
MNRKRPEAPQEKKKNKVTAFQRAQTNLLYISSCQSEEEAEILKKNFVVLVIF